MADVLTEKVDGDWIEKTFYVMPREAAEIITELHELGVELKTIEPIVGFHVTARFPKDAP